jgi:hypothetical protein
MGWAECYPTPSMVRIFGVFLLAAGVIAGPSVEALRAQSAGDLVVSIPGDKEFHQPGCPLVVKAGSNVKLMKRSEAVRRKLTAHPGCRAAESPAAALDPNTAKVYTQPGDNKYHTATCPKLGAQKTAVTLDDAGRKWWPCPVCKPPVRQRTVR